MVKKILNSKKREKGITLVALVVTIIVLLILAGIAISLTIGNNGLFSRAKDAVEKHSEAEAKEKLELVLANISFDKNTKTVNDEYIDTELEKEGMVVIGDIVIVDDWQFEIDRTTPKVGINLGKLIDKQEALKPKIKSGQITIDTTQIGVSIELINEKGTNIIYEIKNVKDNKQVKREETTETNYVFNGLEEGTEYEITIEVANEYGTDNKTKGITTAIKKRVPKLTENTKNIIYSGFGEDFSNRWGRFVLFYAFDGNDSTIAGSTTANTACIGNYIGYDFENKAAITEVTGKIRMLSYKIQYSDDLIIWNDAVTASSPCSDYGDSFSNKIDESVGAHRYWCLYVNGGQKNIAASAQVWSLQFTGKQEKKIIEI